MLTTLLSACLKDAVTTARTEAFFDLPRAKREEHVTKHLGADYPVALREYLGGVTAESFVGDVRGVLPAITASHGVPGHLLESTKEAVLTDYRLDLPSPASRSGTQKVDPASIVLSEEFLSDVHALLREIVQKTETESRPNGFVQAFARALTEEVADALDREESVSFSTKTEALQVIERLLQTGQSVEVGREIQRFLQDQLKVASPTVQSPLPLSALERADIRSSLRERYPKSFPLFEVEPSLGGGLRIFYKGELLDESWMTHIARVFAHLRASH